MHIHYQEYKPSLALRPYVDCYWYQSFKGGQTEESPLQHCLPLGMVELILHLNPHESKCLVDGTWDKLPQTYVVGLWKDTAIWKTTGNMNVFGIRLKPESLLQLSKIPASCVFNTYIEVESFFGKAINEFTEKIHSLTNVAQLVRFAEEFLLRRVKNMNNERSYVIEATKLIRQSSGNLSIDELSENLYISKRQLQRGFKESYGTSPKTYQRIIRFRNAYNYVKQTATTVSWTDVSYHFGYADQAHFIRDFKEFTGAVPTLLQHNEESFFQMTGTLL